MKNPTLLLCIACVYSLSFSQDLVHVWTHTWGNADSAIAPDLAVDDNSNVYAAGIFKGTIDFESGIGTTILTSSAGGFGSSTYICKYDSSGQFQWIKHIKATSQHLASEIVYDPDGFIYVSGYFTGTADFNPGTGVYNLTGIGSNDEMYLLKLDLNGNFIWAISTQGVGNKYVGCISLDDQGNILLGGIFTGTADFDPGMAVSSYTSTSLMNDAFFVKYSDEGTLIWAKAIFGNHRVGVHGVDVDELANVYFVGFFDDQRDFDPGPGVFLLAPFGPSDAWVMKLNALGEFQWLKRLGNDGENIATDVVVNDNYGLFVTGSFSANIDFDQGPPINILIASNWDPFIWKMDTHGEYKWAGQFAGTSFDRANAITMDDHGDLYISGYFTDSVDFDPGPGSYLLTSTGNNDNEDAFVVKLRPNGQFVWAEQAGGLEDDAAGAVQLDPKGNIFATGGFEGKAGFFLGDTEEDSLVSNGSVDIFLTHWNQCHETYNTLVEVSCFASYLSPSGHYTWTQNGIYQDTIKNQNGCDSVLTIDLSIVLVNPEVTIISDGTGLSAVENATSYQWLDCDNKNAPIPGETNQEFYPTQPGYYAVAIDILGCKAISECVYLCLETYITLVEVSCSPSYISPSGHYTWTQNGIYQDTIENAVGCDSLLTIDLSIVIVNSEVTINSDGTGLSAVENATSYQWLDCDNKNTPISGETNQVFYPTQSGNYAVVVDILGCQATSECVYLCHETYNTLVEVSCSASYISPSGNYTWTESGTYLDTIENIAGCDSIITIVLTIIQQELNVIQQGNQLTVEGEAETFSWVDCDNGFTVIDSGLVFTPTSNGNYAVVGETFGCSDTSACVSFVKTANQDISPDNFLIIYPNPTSTCFHIIIPSESEIAKVHIYDVSGTILLSESYRSIRDIFIQEEFPSGLYFVEVSLANGHAVEKLFVSR